MDRLLAQSLVVCLSAACLQQSSFCLADELDVQEPADLAALVADLDANRFAVREQATEKLLETGPTAIPALAKVIEGQSLEAADRAVWILDSFSRSENRDLQVQSLEALHEAKQFPKQQAIAAAKLASLYEIIFREHFEEHGATVTVDHYAVRPGATVTNVTLQLDDNWTGSIKGFEYLKKIPKLGTVELSGSAVSNEMIQHVGKKTKAELLKLEGMPVSPQSVVAIKQANPDLRIHVRHKCVLGVRFMHDDVYEITDVVAGSPAARCGLKPGDVIDSINGNKIDSFDLLTAHISQLEPGDEVSMKIGREGETIEAKTKLAHTGDFDENMRR